MNISLLGWDDEIFLLHLRWLLTIGHRKTIQDITKGGPFWLAINRADHILVICITDHYYLYVCISMKIISYIVVWSKENTNIKTLWITSTNQTKTLPWCFWPRNLLKELYLSINKLLKIKQIATHFKTYSFFYSICYEI